MLEQPLRFISLCGNKDCHHRITYTSQQKRKMQNISNISLEKLDYNSILLELDSILPKITLAVDYVSLKDNLKSYFSVFSRYSSHANLVQYRYFGDTTQTDLAELYQLTNQYDTEVELRLTQLKKVLATSQFLNSLKTEFGENLFFDLKNSTFEYTEKAKEIAVEEAKIQTEITQFKSQSKVVWEGEEIAVGKLYHYTKDNHRAVRKKAFDEIANYHTKHREFFYTKLIEVIQLRNKFAQELGFPTYVEYSLVKWNRIGYNYEQLGQYRDEIVKNFRGVFKKLYDYKAKHLGVDRITYYDNNFFQDGFPELLVKNDSHTISCFKDILEQLNPNWAKLYTEMLDHHTIDYTSRENKVFMGYANYLYDISTPIIYSIFQNNYDDVRVLTHEFGHTLQFCLSYSDREFPHLAPFTLDTVEIFSHSMEMLCLDYVEDFFGKDATKYRIMNYYGHLAQLLTCAMGDEFQEKIYKLSHPTIASIQEIYKSLQEKYTGNYFDSSENDYFICGDKWMEIDHYFNSPFYLVDYSLAIINALNIYKKYRENKADGIALWETLAQNIGNLNYKNISNLSKDLKSPFNAEFIAQTAKFSMAEFDKLLNI